MAILALLGLGGAKLAHDDGHNGLAAICLFVMVIAGMFVYYFAWIVPNAQ